MYRKYLKRWLDFVYLDKCVTFVIKEDFYDSKRMYKYVF